jgi:hypothetical protein
MKNKKILNECILYILKITDNGTTKYSDPCDQCQHIINRYKVKKVVTIYLV